MACKKDHTQIQRIMSTLPTDQGGVGRHKCAACAYEAGFEAGYNLNGALSIDNVLENLEESQAKPRPNGTKAPMRLTPWATIMVFVKELMMITK